MISPQAKKILWRMLPGIGVGFFGIGAGDAWQNGFSPVSVTFMALGGAVIIASFVVPARLSLAKEAVKGHEDSPDPLRDAQVLAAVTFFLAVGLVGVGAYMEATRRHGSVAVMVAATVFALMALFAFLNFRRRRRRP